jgi:hypothetical protein
MTPPSRKRVKRVTFDDDYIISRPLEKTIRVMSTWRTRSDLLRMLSDISELTPIQPTNNDEICAALLTDTFMDGLNIILCEHTVMDGFDYNFPKLNPAMPDDDAFKSILRGEQFDVVVRTYDVKGNEKTMKVQADKAHEVMRDTPYCNIIDIPFSRKYIISIYFIRSKYIIHGEVSESEIILQKI